MASVGGAGSSPFVGQGLASEVVSEQVAESGLEAQTIGVVRSGELPPRMRMPPLQAATIAQSAIKFASEMDGAVPTDILDATIKMGREALQSGTLPVSSEGRLRAALDYIAQVAVAQSRGVG